MGLTIASLIDPRDRTSTLTNVYGYVHRMNVNFTANSYTVEVWIQKDAVSAALNPPPDKIKSITLQPGTVLVPAVAANPAASPPVAGSPAVVMPSLDDFWTLAEATRAANPSMSPKDIMKKTVYDLVKQYHEIVPNTET